MLSNLLLDVSIAMGHTLVCRDATESKFPTMSLSVLAFGTLTLLLIQRSMGPRNLPVSHTHNGTHIFIYFLSAL